MSTDKMNGSNVYEMFEELKKLLKQVFEKLGSMPMQTPSAPIDVSAISDLTERFENVIEEVRKPTIVEHQHRHTIDISSSKVFLSMVIMVLAILGLSYAIGEQRRSISQYQDNDLKYRYIKVHGQTDEENLYRLERQFKYNDSIKIIRKQVEKYEELVKEQAERIERAKREAKEVEKLQKEAESLIRNSK
jgi:hypothetical protein